MIAILLGITLPIVYIIFGSAIAFRVYGKGVENECRGRIKDGRGHSPYCTDCGIVAGLGGFFWPVVPLVWLGKAIGTKQRIFGFRARRAEKVAKHIAEMEREIWGETFGA